MNKEEPPKRRSLGQNAYMKYAGMAFEMLAFMMVGYFIGSYLDGKFGTEKPLFTAGGTLLFLILYLFKLVRDLSSQK